MTNKHKIKETLDSILRNANEEQLEQIENTLNTIRIEYEYVEKCGNGTEVITIPQPLIELEVTPQTTVIEFLDRIDANSLLNVINKYKNKYDMIRQQGYYANVCVTIKDADFKYFIEGKYPEVVNNKLILQNGYDQGFAGGMMKDGNPTTYDIDKIIGKYDIGDIESEIQFAFYW